MTPTAEACSYVRKSVAGRSDMDRSRDNQTAAIAALAERDGATIARVYDGDWGRSGGRSSRGKRSAMAELIEAIRAGSVSALYAYSLDRLARDTEYALTLWNACADQGVPIIVDGSRFDTSDSADRMRYVITGEMSAGELDRITKRNRDIKARARITGTSLGGKLAYGSDPKHPDEHPALVVAAYRKVGSFLGAARSLTAAGVPTRHGRPWTVRSVAVLVRREAPDLAPAQWARKGVSASHTRLFSALLTCYCGSTLTSMPRPGRRRRDGTLGPGSIAYYCRTGHLDTRHGTPYMVSERKVLPWVKAEAARLRVPSSVEVAVDDARRDALAAKRGRWAELFATNRIDLPTFDAKVAPIDEEMARLRLSAQRIVEVPRIDWDEDEPGDINVVLRAMWSEVILGPDLRPVEAVWFDRRLRADD